MPKPQPSPLRPHRPSPLVQVHHLRPLSAIPDNSKAGAGGLVRDPQFWKRFSVAVHTAEVVDKTPKSATSSVGSSYGENWLLQQYQEKRRCRCIGWSIALAIALIITAAVVAGWYFTTIRRA